MIYNLLAPYIHKLHIANLFHYVTFRIGLAILFSLTLSFLIGPRLIRFLQNLQKYGQPIRDDGPETHKAKVGTPTMGGIMILFTVCLSTLLFSDLTNKYIWIVLFVFVSFGVLGFMDDYAKVTKNHHKGVSGKKKLLFQFTICLIACLLLRDSNSQGNNLLTIPFFKNLLIDLGLFYIPFSMFVIVGASNAVNLTDGLDGLAIVPIAITAGSFTLIIYLVGNSFYANYLQIMYIPNISELTIFCASIVGASLGFLWFNAQPAEIFMGDTGSLSLGGVLGVISVITKHEIVLAIIGGLFVIETLSVIIQVYYFKATNGKRIFKMAPLHHHFEKHGWPESKVVIRFWIIAIIFALIGLSSLKLR
ncbi:phospho-N-acetylmuramoyl-pentapeptide-transferase [Candidatus Tisiphia endosymbiont of Ptychoptera albimana]|uniref:phospho-N-acetylmuramoyl-pentapeptide- transferase n=1 Tax=Candidatus Tisiphia endosymbiont of Ptychoptera albimana TaxID=3066260 RepID=UPI00312C8C01